jgi:hypothetical protein
VGERRHAGEERHLNGDAPGTRLVREETKRLPRLVFFTADAPTT